MGDFLSKVGHELTPGTTAAGPTQSLSIPQSVAMPGGQSIPLGSQTVSYTPQRPTFISSFLANLPSALSGGVQASMRPGGGFATGLAGGFQGVQQHDLLMNELGQRAFENQIAANRESREQQEFQSDQQLKQQQLQLAKQNAALARFQIEKDQFGNISIFDKQKALDLVQQGQDPSAALTSHSLYNDSDVDQLDQAILKQSGVDLNKLLPIQQAAHAGALATAKREHNPKPLQDFYNAAAAAQQHQINLQVPSLEPLYDQTTGQLAGTFNRKNGQVSGIGGKPLPQFVGKQIPPGEADKVREQVAAIDRTTEIAQRVQSNLSLVNKMIDAGKIKLATNPQGYLSATVARGEKLTGPEAQLAADIASLSEHINVLRQPLGATGFRGPEAFAALQAQAGNLMGNPAVTKDVLTNTIKALKGIRQGHVQQFPQLFGPSSSSGNGPTPKQAGNDLGFVPLQ